MSIRIVTGKVGSPHITSYQMQAFNRGILGDFALIGENNKMSATKINNNLVRIADGCVVMQGIYAIIPYDDHVDVPIENVEIGYRRIDTIYLHYQKSTETDLEQVNIDVAKGETVRDTPVPPTIPTSDRWEGDVDVKIPMYDIRVTVDGITIIPYERMTKDYPNIYDGGGSDVEVTPIVTTGTKIAEITVDGDTSEIYTPSNPVGSTPPNRANEGDIFIEYIGSATATIATGGGIEIDSQSGDSESGYDINAHFINDFSLEALYFEFDNLKIGETYTLSLDMSISGRMADWGQYAYAIGCTTSYESTMQNKGVPTSPGGTLTELSNGFAITLYYDNDTHTYSHSFVASATKMYVVIDMTFLQNIYSGIDRDIVINHLGLFIQNPDITLKKAYANGEWKDINYVKEIEQKTTQGTNIANVINSDGTETPIYAPSGGGGGGGATIEVLFDTSNPNGVRQGETITLSDDIDNYDILCFGICSPTDRAATNHIMEYKYIPVTKAPVTAGGYSIDNITFTSFLKRQIQLHKISSNQLYVTDSSAVDESSTYAPSIYIVMGYKF